VTCRELHARLRAGQAVGPDVAAHFAECEPCRALAAEEARVARALGSTEPARDLGELFAGVTAAISAERGVRAWLRAFPTRIRVTSAVAVAALLGLAVFIFARRVDFAVYPVGRMALALGLLALGLVTAILRSLRPLQHAPGPRGADHLLVGLGVLAVSILALLAPAHQAHPASLAGAGRDMWARAAACFALGTILGVPLAAALFALDRGGTRRAAVLAVLAAGLLGNLTLQLHCPIVAAPHLLLGHAAIVPVLLVAIVLWRRSG